MSDLAGLAVRHVVVGGADDADLLTREAASPTVPGLRGPSSGLMVEAQVPSDRP